MNGILYKTTTYLAGNLENTSDATIWREELTEKLNQLGINVLDPTKQFLTEQVTENEQDRINVKIWRENKEFKRIHDFLVPIIRRDLRAIDYSSFVIVKIEPDKASYGTIHELIIASIQRKPILILIDNIKLMPIWLIGLVNMDFCFEKIDDLMNYLKQVNEGKIPLDTKYWKLLIPSLR